MDTTEGNTCERKEDFSKNPETYDLIFGVVGATTFDRCQESLKPKGIFLPRIMGLADMVRILWTSITGGKKIRGGVAINNLERMTFIAELAAAGKLRPVIDRSYPLEQIAEVWPVRRSAPAEAPWRKSSPSMKSPQRALEYRLIQKNMRIVIPVTAFPIREE